MEARVLFISLVMHQFELMYQRCIVFDGTIMEHAWSVLMISFVQGFLLVCQPVFSWQVTPTTLNLRMGNEVHGNRISRRNIVNAGFGLILGLDWNLELYFPWIEANFCAAPSYAFAQDASKKETAKPPSQPGAPSSPSSPKPASPGDYSAKYRPWHVGGQRRSDLDNTGTQQTQAEESGGMELGIFGCKFWGLEPRPGKACFQ
jgi:hypothetical protein